MAITDSPAVATTAAAPQRLHRQLSLSGAIALSVGLMGPTMAMNLNPALPASLVGKAVPFVFVVATIGVALVAWSIVTLTSRYHHAGSLYALTGATLGPRPGFLTGWALLATYVAFACTTIIATGIFGAQLLSGLGIWSTAPEVLIAALSTGVMVAIALGEVRSIARVLLSVEGVSIALIALLSLIIIAKVAGGDSAATTPFDWGVLSPSGVASSQISLAIVFGFLSFAGFEASAALGEEAHDPRRNIPRAIAGTVVVAGAFYLLATFAQAEGFGTDAAGVKAYAGSSSLFGDLANQYVGSTMADFVNLGAFLSAFGSALGCLTAGSRLLFAMTRDATPGSSMARLSPRGAPSAALIAIAGFSLGAVLVLRLLATKHGTDIFFWTATVGTFTLLFVYIVTTIGAARLVFYVERHSLPLAVVPAAALLFLGYVLWKNLSPVPAHPYNLFPYMAGAWLAVGAAIVFAVPGLAVKVGQALSVAEGTSDSRS